MRCKHGAWDPPFLGTKLTRSPSLAGFYVVSILAGGFSAIFAYLLSLLKGKQGISGWAWIFVSRGQSSMNISEYWYCHLQLVEGAITIIFGIFTWFFIPDFPDQNKFLTQEQTTFILARVERDRGDSIPDALTGKKVVEHLLDWKAWAFGEIPILVMNHGRNSPRTILAVMYLCATMPAYAIGWGFSCWCQCVLTSRQILCYHHSSRNGLECHTLITSCGSPPGLV